MPASSVPMARKKSTAGQSLKSAPNRNAGACLQMLTGIKHAPKSMYRPTAVMLNGRDVDEVGTAGLPPRSTPHSIRAGVTMIIEADENGAESLRVLVDSNVFARPGVRPGSNDLDVRTKSRASHLFE